MSKKVWIEDYGISPEAFAESFLDVKTILQNGTLKELDLVLSNCPLRLDDIRRLPPARVDLVMGRLLYLVHSYVENNNEHK